MGKAIARQLLQDGLTVVAAARGVDKMADLVGLGAHAVALDVSDPAGIERAIAEVTAAHGGVDVLVNNAGFGLYGAIEDVPLADARYQFEVNLFGAARLTQLVLPSMRAKRAGTIINISSMGGKIYTSLGGWYHASKHAVEGWSDCLRLEVAPFGIDVVIIEPGLIETGFGDALTAPLLQASGDGPYAQMARNVARSTAHAYQAGRGTKPEAVARVVSRALQARRPRTRYAVGRYARPMLWMRKYLGDRLFDRIIRSQMG
jgi:NAD(P)-dependent dehydrogenase (short-subunit alcohol dehydrogenase family)